MSGVTTVLNLLGVALITSSLYAALYTSYTGIDRFGCSGHTRGALLWLGMLLFGLPFVVSGLVLWLGLALFGLPLVISGLADDRARRRSAIPAAPAASLRDGVGDESW